MEQAFYYYYYSIVSALAMGIHLIIHWKQLFDWRGATHRTAAVEYRIFLIALALFFPCDFLWGVFAELKWIRALYCDTVCFFVVLAICVHTWTRFAVTYLEMDGWPRRTLLWARYAMLAIFLISLVANHFTGSFFRMDASNVYRTGPLRDFILIMLIAFNVLSSALTLRKVLTTKHALRRRNVMVFVFCLTIVATILIQFWHPLLPFYAIGFLLGGCLLHVFVAEDTLEEAHRKELLAHDYALRLKTEQAANKAKSLFFSSVSHDIRTPLNAIIGFSELLRQGVRDAGERDRFIDLIHSSGEVLARLVDDILDLSRLESGKMDVVNEPTYIPGLVREVIDACEIARSRKSLDLKTEIDDIPFISVDPHRIRQILFNLLSNAYKYTPQGTITVSAHWNDGVLELSVADTGIGISDEDKERILQPFVQAVDKNNRNGSGLGLSICTKLASLMGGKLTISSKLGVGSTFTVTLRNVATVAPPQGMPECPEIPEIPEAAASQAHHAHAALNARVLVVDDSPVNRIVLKAMLAKCGVTNVAFAENGGDAFETLQNDHGFDMVLSDLWMPIMDGYALIKAIRADANLSSLPVYLITADCDARNQAESSGFTGILLKPVTLAQLQPLFKR